ncbi:MAG: 6-phosphogluconolactonase [Pseudobdellovibrionaceae bacterium]|jgi:glucosamine-6-phosphate deaminase|nr:6-phosphogluconolactonase [Pseudobdellovibrionaceae bacterium]
MPPRILITNNNTDFGHIVCSTFLDALRHSQDVPSVVLPTGNTPLPFYAALRAKVDKIDFKFLQLDEYMGCSPESETLFSKWIAREVLDPLQIDDRFTFNSAADPSEEVARIRSHMESLLFIDLVVLGIGQNGHIGLLEPGADFDCSVSFVEMSEATWNANCAYWGKDIPKSAITLGFQELRKARQTFMLALGASKAKALYRAFYGDVTPDCPASYLQTMENVTIIADRDALSLFPV